MNIKLILDTVVHLKAEQIAYQIRYRLAKPEFKAVKCPEIASDIKFDGFIPKFECYNMGNFSFLNIEDKFNGWNDIRHGMLWAYNLNYMDWLLQPDTDFEEACKWIDRFIDGLSENKIGLDPYPIALRGINWIKFISRHKDKIEEKRLQRWNDSLYSQYKLLEKKIEYHLLGNHLLEDAYSIFIASIYFNGQKLFKKASGLLESQLKEQVLPDGAHYEQSPMYHCILLDRLLDCYNFSFSNNRFGTVQTEFNENLAETAKRMLGHLQAIVYADSTIPMLNDSANGIAPTPRQLFDYAERLGIEWQPMALKECGYRKYSESGMEAVVDAGNITASYQPGHSHADTFNYELRINGKPVIADTGISTYDKTPRRQLERSTMAHNTVTADDRNSSEVWSGFRIGKRAKVTIIEETEKRITASHNGFGHDATHTRTFQMDALGFTVSDHVAGNHYCKSYLHFANGIEILRHDNDSITTNLAKISIKGAKKVEIINGKISTEYNRFTPIKIAILNFSKELKYTIATI